MLYLNHERRMGCCGCAWPLLLLAIVLLCGLLSAISNMAAQMDSAESSTFSSHDAQGIVRNALAMAAHLHLSPPDNYDVSYDSDFPQSALTYLENVCPDCSAWANGNFQCTMLVIAAYGLANYDLEVPAAAIDFWGDYQQKPGWIETSIPTPGDIIVWSSPYFNGEGHVAIVTHVTAPTSQLDGSLTFAEANGPAPLVTQTLLPGYILDTWTNYTVMGYIHPVTTSSPAASPTSVTSSHHTTVSFLPGLFFSKKQERAAL